MGAYVTVGERNSPRTLPLPRFKTEIGIRVRVKIILNRLNLNYPTCLWTGNCLEGIDGGGANVLYSNGRLICAAHCGCSVSNSNFQVLRVRYPEIKYTYPTYIRCARSEIRRDFMAIFPHLLTTAHCGPY